jgi:hypothetical protein
MEEQMMRAQLKRLFVIALAVAGMPLVARADGGDSSADAAAGFHRTLSAASGIMIRVPHNANGDENTNAAELRVYSGHDSVTDGTNLQTVWNEATPAPEQQHGVTDADVTRDSSTWGWYGNYGYNNWGYNNYYYGYGYQNYGYYYNWNPCYYYSGSYYNYGYPYSYGYGNYNYYYYPYYY